MREGEAPLIAMVSSEPLTEVDAGHYCARNFWRAVRECTGVRAELVLRGRDGSWRKAGDDPAERQTSLAAAVLGCDVLVLHYNPHTYGRWGFAPWLPGSLVKARTRSGARIALHVHELQLFVPRKRSRWTLMALWQRAQFEAVRLAADVVLTAIEAWTIDLDGRWPRTEVHHVPVGSNLPDERRHRANERARLGVGDGDLVVASFGTAHPSRQWDTIVRATNAAAEVTGELVLLNLGANAPELKGVRPGVRVLRPGRLPADAVARHLAAADLLLAPFVDGVSTKRGSVMAALQHELPVVGTDGELTDSVLRRSDALRLVPAGHPDLFADAARVLAAAPQERAKLGRAAGELFRSEFDWPVLARRLLAALGLDAAVGDPAQARNRVSPVEPRGCR
jgi:glycosyltransferase involved in cell wall biosynthesis